MPLRVSCPYCNTAFTVAAIPATGRVDCPRCGDGFPVRGGEGNEPGESRAAGGAESDGEPQPQPRPPQPQSSSRMLVPAAVAAIVAFGIGAGWYYFRDDFRPDPSPSDPIAVASSPTSLRGLAFVPADSNILFAFQPGPIIRYCERTNQDPRVLLTSTGIPGAVFVKLDRAGVPLQQIDQVVIGARIPDAADLGQLRLAIALILRTPLEDEKRFLESVAARPEVQSGKTRFQVELGGFPFKLVKASPTAWVFGWADEDLGPASGGEPRTRLPAPLLETLAQQLPGDAAVWLATASENWAEKRSVQQLAEFKLVKSDWLARLAKGRAVAAGLTVADEPRLRVSVRCQDGATADSLRNFFRETMTGDGTQHGGAGEWATLDMPFDPQTSIARLKNRIGEAR